MSLVRLDGSRTLRRDQRTDCCTFTLHHEPLLVSSLELIPVSTYHPMLSMGVVLLGGIYVSNHGLIGGFVVLDLLFLFFTPYNLLQIDTTV